MFRWVGAFFIVLLIGVAVPVLAADWFKLPFSDAGASPTLSAPRAGGIGTSVKAARVSWLDKQTNQVQKLVMTVGTTQNLGNLNVTLTKCLADYEGEINQDVAWLEVRESGRDAPWFAGWMFSAFPEVATLDHPRYNLQLMGCGEQARRKPDAVGKGPVVETITPGADSEAPDHDEESPVQPQKLPENGDAFLIPGVEKTSAPTDMQPQAVGEAPSPVVATPVENVHPEVAPEPVVAAPQEQPTDELQQMMDHQ